MQVGQKVRVSKLKDSGVKAIAKKVGEVGVIKELKILDGSKWGFIVAFPDTSKTWFFADELEAVA